jgi:hypothetical protein
MRAKLIKEDIGNILKPKSEEDINKGLQTRTRNPNISSEITKILDSIKNDVLHAVGSDGTISGIKYAFEKNANKFLQMTITTYIGDEFGLTFNRHPLTSFSTYWRFSGGYLSGSSTSRNLLGIAQMDENYIMLLALNSTYNALIAAIAKIDSGQPIDRLEKFNVIIETKQSQSLGTASKNIKKMLKDFENIKEN